MPEIILPSTKDRIETATLPECEAALKNLCHLFGNTHDPELIVKYKLCKTRLQSRIQQLKLGT